MKLIVVESPTKARTIGRYISKEYQILATMGHIRDLPKSKFGVEIKKKNNKFKFIPDYITDSRKNKAISQLKQAASKAKEIFLATDPDREGEAISWHVTKIIKHKFKRVSFHEITKSAIEKAFQNPHKIDMHLVNAQQARRILDRLVGYSLSPLLWKKIRRGLSAGRVQSVAVRLIVEREREIEKFKKEKYYRVLVSLGKKQFLAQLASVDNKSIEKKEKHKLFAGTHIITKTNLNTPKKAEKIILNLEAKLLISKIKKREALKRPYVPFITSTLQQEVSRRFSWSSKQTMRIAQSLFEKGHITYHRTDSISLAQPAINSIRKLIERDYGKNYLPEKPVFYKTRSKLAQEAHEAIRPTKLSTKFEARNSKLEGKEKRLYQLIWQRTVACQMTPAKLAQTKVELLDNKCLFVANGSQIIFDGFTKVYPLTLSENILPSLKEGEKVKIGSLGITKHETQPPPRYNEASLIAALEKNGIGRPSTYAPTISTIQNRLYVEKKEKRFYPSPVGMTTNDFLVQHFPDIVDLPFTAEMEEFLDKIAEGKKEWQPILSDFWKPFSQKLYTAEKKAERMKVPVEETNKKCPKCKKGKLVIRTGRFGKFIACDQFPNCDYKESYYEKVDFKCPECNSEVVIKRTKRGAKFYSCKQWPKCSWSSWRKPKIP